MADTIVITEAASQMRVRAVFHEQKAPATTALFRAWLTRPRTTNAVHGMWTGPELSCQINLNELPADIRQSPLPPENATINPLAGELVFLRLPPHTLDSGPDEIFDIGLFYGERARLLFPFGLLPGTVFGRILSEDMEQLVAACAKIRSAGRTRLNWALV